MGSRGNELDFGLGGLDESGEGLHNFVLGVDHGLLDEFLVESLGLPGLFGHVVDFGLEVGDVVEQFLLLGDVPGEHHFLLSEFLVDAGHGVDFALGCPQLGEHLLDAAALD